MILVNRNFGNPTLSQAIGDMFKPTSDSDQNIDWINHTNTLVSGSSLVSNIARHNLIGAVATYGSSYPRNSFIVTEHFLRVLDKVYTKIWNESFTETGLYEPTNLSTLYNAFVTDISNGAASPIGIPIIDGVPTYNNFMLFKKFIDRAIDAGVLLEEDRLDYQDQISVIYTKINLSTQVDLTNKLITFTSAAPMDVIPDVDTREGTYLYGKKLFLMITPYLDNYATIKGGTTAGQSAPLEPFTSYIGTGSLGVSATYKRPIAFFKPKTPESKFGRSLPLATHLFWRIGTPEEKEMALLEGKTGIDVPEIIFDHLDRISHIDSFVLKVKYDKLQF